MQEKKIWPTIREDLQLHEGARSEKGEPGWVIQDPASNRFFQINQKTYEVLIRWHMAAPDAIAKSITENSPFNVTDKFVEEVVQFLERSQLVKLPAGSAVTTLNKYKKAKQSWFNWALHHYLFFRLPLVRPDKFLDRTVDYIRPIYHRRTFYIVLLITLSGLFFVSRQWDVFMASVVDMFSIEGLAYFMVALGISKVGHELGHAYVAKIHGCRVPTMGVAFLVLWPMLYTDTNQTWQLTSRKKRLSVGAAGMAVELTLAGCATLLWSFLPDGGARDMALVLATTAWVSSLLINVSPFMRFDGYFLLSDMMGMPNLHQRSFALGRWRLREWLFDLKHPIPEKFTKRREVFLIGFAYFVWIYRLLLFLGIAVMVYSFFIKAVGILLFIVEMVWFVFKPIWNEMKIWHKIRGEIMATKRTRITAMAAVVLILSTFIPWSSTLTAPALLRAEQSTEIFTQHAAVLQTPLPENGQFLDEGAQIIQLHDPALPLRERSLSYQTQRLNYERTLSSLDDEYRRQSDSVISALIKNQAERDVITQQQAALEIKAPFSGYLVDVNDDLSVGQWVSGSQRIGRLVHMGTPKLTAYISEKDRIRLQESAKCRFSSLSADTFHLPCRITEIERIPVRDFQDLELASLNGGSIPVLQENDGYTSEKSIYRVHLTLAEGTDFTPLMAFAGQVKLSASAESLVGRAYLLVTEILFKESGW